MLRKLAKSAFAAGLHRIGVDKMVSAHRHLPEPPLVLSYHRVVENFRRSAAHSIAPMLVSTATFEAQLDWIGRHYEFISLDDLAPALEAGRNFRKPVAAITFDDGYGDTYYNAFPILKRKGIPSTVFVVTDLLGTNELQVHDELHLLAATASAQWRSPARELEDVIRPLTLAPMLMAQLCEHLHEPFRFTRLCLELLTRAQISTLIALIKQRVTITDDTLHEFHALSWEMLKHIASRGVIVGSHTRSHLLLANENWTTMLDEIKGSRLQLEQRLGRKIKHFAYPDGHFNSDTLNAVAVAGYRYAYTTCMHRDRQQPMLTIPRRVLWENSCLDAFGRFSPSILSCQIHGIFDPARRCRQDHWASAS